MCYKNKNENTQIYHYFVLIIIFHLFRVLYYLSASSSLILVIRPRNVCDPMHKRVTMLRDLCVSV